MSVSLIVATILIFGWNLVLTAAAFFTETGLFHSGEQTIRSMARTKKQLRAEVGKPDLDARTEAWKRDTGTAATEYLESRITETPRKVTVEAPYAEASVTVAGEHEPELRRCSVCMN